MDTFIGTISGIVFGGIFTYLASRYFYKKSVKSKNLSCFVQYVSEILTDIEPEVKKKLSVEYEGQIVDNLYQVQFIIANTGDYAIRDFIKPLTLPIPYNGEVLDTNIVYIEPSGRDVVLEYFEDRKEVEFKFSLLNSGEYFVAKLLIKGEVPKPKTAKAKLSDDEEFEYIEFEKYNFFKFKITVSDLPPELTSERLPHDYFEFSPRYFDSISLWIGGIIGLISFIIGYVLFNLKNFNPSLFLFNFNLFFTDFSVYKGSIILAWFITALLAGVAVGLPSSLLNFRTKKKTKFRLPEKLAE